MLWRLRYGTRRHPESTAHTPDSPTLTSRARRDSPTQLRRPSIPPGVGRTMGIMEQNG